MTNSNSLVFLSLHRFLFSLKWMACPTIVEPFVAVKRTMAKQTDVAKNERNNFLYWPCKDCTFFNVSAPNSELRCAICEKPKSPPQVPKWSCTACTFLNSYKNDCCEICGTRVNTLTRSLLDNLGKDDLVASEFFPLRAIRDKRKGKAPVDMGEVAGCCRQDDENERGGKRHKVDGENAMKDGRGLALGQSSIFKILTYNVWFREDLEVHQRMEAIGDLILEHSPDLICFQEVTVLIYEIFQKSRWWKRYQCSVPYETARVRSYFCMQLCKCPVKSFYSIPFQNSHMGRELCMAELEVGGKSLVISTSHLESPSPAPPKWDQMFSKERVEQAQVALNHLDKNPNVIFCGDMNWDEKLDGNLPLPSGWVDAWAKLNPRDDGWTYDTKRNQMLYGNKTLQKRLDRFLCRLDNFKINGIEMIGMEAIQGLSYTKEKNSVSGIKSLVLPVLPSDHYGLLLTISENDL